MKRTATLVAGLLLVTGTIFAAPTVVATGEILYKNTVFNTDTAILQNDPANATANGDTQALTATATVKFDAANSLVATVKEGNDDSVKLEYTYAGKETVVTASTISDDGENKGLFQEVNLKAVNTKGNVKAQVAVIVKNDIYGAAPNGQSDVQADTGADAMYLQYQVTPSVQTTFYPYATKFGVDSVFNDDGTTSEIKGIKGAYDYTKSETLTEKVAGVKVAMTAGALKGLAVKVGTAKDNTDDATFYVDAEYSKTVGIVTVKADFTMTTDDVNAVGDTVKQALMLDATAKVGTIDLQGQLFQAAGLASTEDVQAIYVKASTTMSGVALLGEASSKTLGTADAVNGVYLEGKYTLAEVSGVKPAVTVSFKDVDLGEESVAATVTAKVDANIVKDGITVTPALEISNNGDMSTKATIAVKYSF